MLSFSTKKLRDKRKTKGLTMEEVAKRANMSLSGYTFIETGRRKPGAESLARIAGALRTKLEYFFE